MAQDGNTPTSQEIQALQAKIDALNQQVQLLTAQKALQDAQSAASAAAQVDAATQAANLAAQQKAISDAQTAIAKNNLTVPDSGYKGEVSAGDKAGSFEASLLASKALTLAADNIATKVKTARDKGPGWNTVVLYANSDVPDFQSLLAYDAQRQAISDLMGEASQDIEKTLTQYPAARFLTPATIGMGMDAANKILGYFRTDYSIQGIVVASDDLQLINALAGALTEKNIGVYLPAIYNAMALNNSSVVSELKSLADQRAKLQGNVDKATGKSDELTAEAAKETDVAKKKQLTDGAAKLKDLAASGKNVVAACDAFLTKLTTADDKSKVPLAIIAQQRAVREQLSKGGAVLMTAKVSSAGGTYYTKKNMWTFFGAMPFYVMGGAVINFTVMEGPGGKVIVAGALPVDAGYYKATDVAKQFELTK